MMIQTIPIQASHWILPRVLMLERPMATMAATATNAAVHVPCSDTAFNPIEIPSMPDPATKMKAIMLDLWNSIEECLSHRLTDTKSSAKDIAADAAKQDCSCVIKTVYLGMVHFEYADHVTGPGGNSSDCQETDNAGNKAKDIKARWDREDTKTNTNLHHDCDGSHPVDLKEV